MAQFGLSAEDALTISKKYTEKTIMGEGAIKGKDGADGKSAYDLWLEAGNVGSEQDFLDSLKGEGADGFSPVITENSNNTDEDYRLDIETKESKFTTPNLKADISKNIAEHNTSPDSHNDIRIFLNELNNRLNALANSDDETLDEMKEVVAYIKDNRSLIESITTTKVNVADIIDNLTTNVSNKPLSASQGVVIKNLIDTLQSELTAHANNADIHVTASDKNTLNTVADNSQFTSASLSKKGWYRIAEYSDGDINTVRGSSGNSCEIIIKRLYINNSNEEHRLLLKSKFLNQKFVPISCNSNTLGFTKIRYVYNSTIAYIDVYYNLNSANTNSFAINDGKDSLKKWQAITPTLVEETAEGEAVSTVFDIPANANPVTDLDLAKYLPLTGGKMTGIISTNNDLAKVTPSPAGLSGSGHSQGIIFLNKDNAEFGTFGAMGTGGTFDKIYIGFGNNSWQNENGLEIKPASIKWKGSNLVTDLDLTIDAIQGLRAELDELRSLITNS